MEPQTGNRTLLVTLLAVVLTALITGGVVYTVQNKQNNDMKANLQSQIDNLKRELVSTKQASSPTPTASPAVTSTPTATPSATASSVPTATPSATTDPTANWSTFSRQDYSVKYPSSWVKSYNELAGSEVWYENATKQSAGTDQALISISATTLTNTTVAQQAQLRKDAIEQGDQFTATISSVTIGRNTFTKIVAINKTTGQVDTSPLVNSETGYLTSSGNTMISIAPNRISEADLQNMLQTLVVK